MDLVGLILHLRANAAVFEGRVAGVAEMSEAMESEVRPAAAPSAYVVPLGEEAALNDASNALYQLVTERVGVCVLFSNVADRRGQGVTEQYAAVAASIRAAMLNWRGLDPEHALRGFEAASASLVAINRARAFYQWEFTLETLLSTEDGWQLSFEPLLEIDGNTGPDDPQPGFRVVLPQT